MVDGRVGYAATELFEEEEIRGLVYRASENAKAVEREDKAGIYDGKEKYSEAKKTAFSELDTSEIKKLATELARCAYDLSPKVTDGTESSAGSSSFTVRIANSYGLDLENRGGINYLNLSTVVSDAGERESGYEIRQYDENTKLEDVAKKAIKSVFGRGDTPPLRNVYS